MSSELSEEDSDLTEPETQPYPTQVVKTEDLDAGDPFVLGDDWDDASWAYHKAGVEKERQRVAKGKKRARDGGEETEEDGGHKGQGTQSQRERGAHRAILNAHVRETRASTNKRKAAEIEG